MTASPLRLSPHPPGMMPELKDADARLPDHVEVDKQELEDELDQLTKRLDRLQRRLYAEGKRALLVVLQGRDASGKDGTLRKVFGPLDPLGVTATSFKAPTEEVLRHDFLWRIHRAVPARGTVGGFNRSHYEDVLVVRVRGLAPESVWRPRYEQINLFERILAEHGTVILKFWLNVSKDEQKARFLSRIDEPEKNWKFSLSDIKERKHWDRYMEAYEEALNETSRPWAPWYAIPADSKSYMRESVARILVDTLRKLDLKYPEVDAETLERLGDMKKRLEEE